MKGLLAIVSILLTMSFVCVVMIWTTCDFSHVNYSNSALQNRSMHSTSRVQAKIKFYTLILEMEEMKK